MVQSSPPLSAAAALPPASLLTAGVAGAPPLSFFACSEGVRFGAAAW